MDQNNQCIIQEYTGQLYENPATIQAKDRQLLDNQHKIASRDEAVAVKEREMKQTQDQLRARQQLVSEFQISLSQKDKTISVLQQTISDYKRKIQELEQQDSVSKYQPQHHLIMTPQMIKTQKNINSMIWRDGKSVPEKMTRGAARVRMGTQPTSNIVSGPQTTYRLSRVRGVNFCDLIIDHPPESVFRWG